MEIYQIPPTRYLQLPWREFGEVDFLLTEGFRQYKRLICSCGCGQWRAECQDSSTEGRWQVNSEICYAREAISEFQEKHKDDLPAGLMLGVELLPMGVIPRDPLEVGEEDARAAIAAMRARHNLT